MMGIHRGDMTRPQADIFHDPLVDEGFALGFQLDQTAMQLAAFLP